MYVTPVYNSKHNNAVEFLATDINDPKNPKYYLGGEDWKTQAWHQLTPAEQAAVKMGPSADGMAEVAVGLPGYKAMTLAQIIGDQTKRRHQFGAQPARAQKAVLDPADGNIGGQIGRLFAGPDQQATGFAPGKRHGFLRVILKNQRLFAAKQRLQAAAFPQPHTAGHMAKPIFAMRAQIGL